MNDLNLDEIWMRRAIRQAELAAEDGDVPIGAVIIHGTAIIGQAHNQVERLKDPTAHAEMIAITQAAAALGDWRLLETVLYVTKEPCPMCAGAITLARIPRVVFGAPDLQNAGILKCPEIIRSVLEAECRDLLQAFFKSIRKHP
ncbi:MAG: nucleoside deaminase [Verrucomicrobia bacterium]|nr:nucleoside deaminase [Verrucomicrobiota bacterium]MBU4247897.1 nucleoside deaminase [Verrucomicrobiota bacterium]MBU4290266.1 nucleoside deaminase [Verrucomicrobiota bacterium]MBU4429019.1 nucleoside deaminase [Verrucomicrobiota bacterium]MCG2678705.1 nucleoside deaminase [Kiritimatiellia bacterium]